MLKTTHAYCLLVAVGQGSRHIVVRASPRGSFAGCSDSVSQDLCLTWRPTRGRVRVQVHVPAGVRPQDYGARASVSGSSPGALLQLGAYEKTQEERMPGNESHSVFEPDLVSDTAHLLCFISSKPRPHSRGGEYREG